MPMKFGTLILALLFSHHFFSHHSFAACESYLKNYAVLKFNWLDGSNSYELSNGWYRMTLGVHDREMTDTRLDEMNDLLYDMWMLQGTGIVNFGVDERTCQLIDQYQLPENFGGSWTTLSLQNVTFIKRVH